jgi:pimeloyl-ACP methyl ester carboxylesterase
VKASSEWLKLASTDFSPDSDDWGYAQLSSYTAEYREWGFGPPIVLVPGLAGGTGLMAPIARKLAENFRVITYQLRGEDDCFALRRRFGVPDLINDLNEFLEWRCLESPAIFGVSFGGILALEYAARYPRKLSALVLQGVGANFEQGLLERVAAVVLARYPLPTDNPFVNQFFNLLFGSRQEPGPLFEFVTRQCWQTDQGVMARRFQLVEQFDVRPRLSRICVPTLAIAGERDLLVSAQGLRDLSAGIRHSKMIQLSGAGHLATVSHTTQLAEEVRHFLEPLSAL